MAGSLTVMAMLVAASFSRPVAAHDGEPAVELLPNRAVPGATVRIAGDDFQPGAGIQVHLLTADGPRLMGEAPADEEGHLDLRLQVPDIPPRVYEIRVSDGVGLEVSTYLTVTDSAASTPSAGRPVDPAAAAILLGIAGVALLAFGLLGGRERRGHRRRRGATTDTSTGDR